MNRAGRHPQARRYARRLSLLAVLAFAAARPCPGDESPPAQSGAPTALSSSTENLTSLYETARIVAPIEISAHSDFVAQQEQVPQARAAFLPRISILASSARDKSDLDTGRENSYPSKGYTISLRQSLFDAPSWQAYRQAKAGAARAHVIYGAAEQLLMLQVCESYFAVLGAQDDQRFATHHVRMLQDQLELAQQRYAQGDATIVDTQEATAELGRANADVQAADNALQLERANLRRRVAHDVGPIDILPDDVSLTPFRETDEEMWVTQAIDHSPDVEQRRLTEYIAWLEVTKARAAFLPTVSVTLSHSAGNLQYLNNQVSVNTAENTNSFRQGTANVAMLQVSIPLFDGLSTVSREREARAQKEKARADLDDARLEAETREKQIYLDLSSAFAREHTLADALKSSELALASNRAAYEVGLRINSDVLRAEDTVYATQRDLAHSRYEIVLDHLRLRANAGVLSLNDLRTVDALLVPAAGDGSLEAARILTGINDKQ